MSAAIVGLASIQTHRRVEHVMGMPVSVALRGRHATTAVGDDGWFRVVQELREVDRTFSTYRPDSTVNRLDRGEITLEQCPPEVAQVLALGSDAEQQSAGAFSTTLPDSSGSTPVVWSRAGRWSGPHGSSPHWTTPTSACPPAATWSATSPTRTVPPGGSASSTRSTGDHWLL